MINDYYTVGIFLFLLAILEQVVFYLMYCQEQFYAVKLQEKENEIISLKERELLFRNQVFRKSGFQARIRDTGGDRRKKDHLHPPFKHSDLPALVQCLNECYDNYVCRLNTSFPELKEREIEICCLLKAGGKTMHIAVIIGMTANAVTKKKRLLLIKMNLAGKYDSLDCFLASF